MSVCASTNAGLERERAGQGESGVSRREVRRPAERGFGVPGPLDGRAVETIYMRSRLRECPEWRQFRGEVRPRGVALAGLDRGDESIPVARHGFDERGILAPATQGFPQA